MQNTKAIRAVKLNQARSNINKFFTMDAGELSDEITKVCPAIWGGTEKEKLKYLILNELEKLAEDVFTLKQIK